MIKKLITIAGMALASVASGQYQMEYLNRGVVAVRTGNNNFVSWRWLGTEDNITFNLYRNGTKVNANPLTVTNYTDNGAPAGASYTVRTVVNNIEQAASEAATTWGQNYLNVPIQRPSTAYSANDCSVADVDGDGILEILLKWDPANAKDNSQSGVTDNVFVDCYRLNGTRLWRVNLGRNIRAGAHYTQMAFYDFDGDGKAEFMCKTADGTIDGQGKVIGNASADYRNSGGYILTGPEFITVFNGLTGAAMATSNYIPARGNVGSWGDTYGNRVDRFRVGVAYLDGKRPTALFGRGYYTRLVMAAWDWRDGKLTNRWTFDSNTSGNSAYAGQGNHSLSIADVDNDGKQEIISGAAIIDDDGKPYYSTGFGHGDAGHVSDLDPDLPGIEVVNIQERFANQGLYMYSATSKRVLWTKPSVAAGSDGEGPGRGVSADISAAHRGNETWAAGAGITGVFNAKGVRTNLATPSSCNFLAWWDGDLLRELLNGTSVSKYGGGTLLNASGCASNNGSKSTPGLSGDILGDWREEVIFRTSDNSALRIYTTTIPTTHKFRTLLHDPQYRMALAWQNGAYNQPPHVGFYLGDGMTTPAKPNITIGSSSTKDCFGVLNGSATIDACGRCSGGTTGKVACSILIEAEDVCDFDGVEETTNAGFKGLSYVNVPNQVGAKISFNILAQSAGIGTLSFRFANGGTANRPGQLTVNGTPISPLVNFPATASWTDWQQIDVQVSLAAGVNKFVLSSTTVGGLPNLDQIGFAGNGLSKAGCGIVARVDGYDASQDIAVFPNPSNAGFNLHLPESSKVKITNLQGIVVEELEGIGQLYFGEGYAAGIYLVEVSVQNQSRIFKVSKN